MSRELVKRLADIYDEEEKKDLEKQELTAGDVYDTDIEAHEKKEKIDINKLIKARLKINNFSVEIHDIKRMIGWRKGWGLIFSTRDDSNALLFEFDDEKNRAITSIFCPPFLAIWLNNENKIQEYKVVSPGRLSVKPKKAFSKLIEVPLNNKYSKIIEFILEKGKV